MRMSSAGIESLDTSAFPIDISDVSSGIEKAGVLELKYTFITLSLRFKRENIINI